MRRTPRSPHLEGLAAVDLLLPGPFALAWFRSKPNVRLRALAFGLSQATGYRYLDEVIAILAARAPDLHQALEQAVADGVPHRVLDCKICGTARCRVKAISAADRQPNLKSPLSMSGEWVYR